MSHRPTKTRRDWLLTVRQTIPRLRRILAELRPTYHLHDVRDVTVDFLRTQEIYGLIWDVDGTLTNYHGMEIADELRDHVDTLFEDASLNHAILSNCDEQRFDELKKVFSTLPLIRAYQSEAGTVFRTAIGQKDSHSPADVASLLDSGATQIRKPSDVLVKRAVAVLDLAPERCVMVGDQYFTDIASANLAGIRSIKVQTFGRKSFPRSIRTTQRLEPIVFRLWHGRP